MKLSQMTYAVNSCLLFLSGLSSTVFAENCMQLMEKQDFKNAEEICSQSCDDGDGYSCYALGKILAEFGETSQDYQEAATYLTKACKKPANCPVPMAVTNWVMYI